MASSEDKLRELREKLRSDKVTTRKVQRRGQRATYCRALCTAQGPTQT
jgi:hypothetical protein